MLYLIDPSGAVWQSELTLGRAIARQRVDGRLIDDLPFTRAPELIAFEDIVDLALRHGVAAPRGILLDAGWVGQVRQPGLLKVQRANQRATAEQLEPVDLFTPDAGNVSGHRRQTLHEVAPRHLDKRIEKAEQAARDALQADPRRELVQHWRGLGGVLPETIVADLDSAR